MSHHRKNMEIFLISDVMDLLKISKQTLYRWLRESRTGRGTFPLPISQRNQTLRWNAADIYTWCQAKPVTPAKKRKVPAKTKQQREHAAADAMQRHGLTEAEGQR